MSKYSNKEGDFFSEKEKPYFYPLILAVPAIFLLITYLVIPISAHTMVFLFVPAMALAFFALIGLLVVYMKGRRSSMEVET
ncbi:hypothetical protein [Methanonatronarchaeum sp. AMET-Sl]|uniref:hypothetical protein n=1 Tax=Methanonatronarchaeum sp. AMET-Sl TaxID=3037654 RepID=UPI00244E4A59|nr:hypothetical protein [Methanonatronarchaeum sp. AMET-Sl]WGI16795.1 hypothetical protein QEN48_04680 [Methanonatronarchaeum sp. AMET-Sl]